MKRLILLISKSRYLFILILLLTMFLEICFSQNPLYSNNEKIKIYYTKDDSNTYSFYADNFTFWPYYIKLKFTELLNMKANVNLPFTKTLKPNELKQYLFTIKGIKSKAYKYSYTYNYYNSNPNAKHNDSYLYLFPFEHGFKHPVGQGYNGSFSHKDKLRYSVDFDMKEGTQIVAARGGTVVDVKDDSNVGGPSESYKKDGNYISIIHDDGSYANYIHLRKNGSLVKPGNNVKPGDIIGYSGNTGWSSGPHLHFHVAKGSGETIPVKFLNYNGKAVSVREGLWYYSYHTGKKHFKVILGHKLKNSTYKNYKETTETDNKFSIETERIDDTYIFFAKNGYNKEKTLTLNFTVFENITSSKSVPLIANIPANSKIFLLLIRKKNSLEKWKFNYRYSYK
ncbi:MAG: M23 family metallopeptidase [Spirochaetota bacterium]|nr:M23 family metallopeptidase [Spirochaetota bacterium]